MENRDGNFIIDKICDRLREEDRRLYDANIICKLRDMNKYQIMQLVNLGDVQDWHNDRYVKFKDLKSLTVEGEKKDIIKCSNCRFITKEERAMFRYALVGTGRKGDK